LARHAIDSNFCPAERTAKGVAEFAIMGQEWELTPDITPATCLRDYAARCLAAAEELEAAEQKEAQLHLIFEEIERELPDASEDEKVKRAWERVVELPALIDALALNTFARWRSEWEAAGRPVTPK
jgi:hypothetical protein